MPLQAMQIRRFCHEPRNRFPSPDVYKRQGVDRLYVDEAHNYKNLFLYTKMRNVAGLSATDAQKSSRCV